MDVNELQSNFQDSEVDPFYSTSLAMMEAGYMIESFMSDDDNGIEESLFNVTRFLMKSAVSAGVDLDKEVEKVESYENINSDTILFMLVSDISKVGTAAYNEDYNKFEDLVMNCMRDIAALDESFGVEIEERF
jgi:hypothetical protein